MMTVSQQVTGIRRAIRKCGKTPYRVAKDAGLSPSVVYRFLDGSNPTIGTMDRIAHGANVTLYLRKA